MNPDFRPAAHAGLPLIAELIRSVQKLQLEEKAAETVASMDTLHGKAA